MSQSTPIIALRSALFFLGNMLITIFFSVTGVLIFGWMPFKVRGRYFILGNGLIVWWLCLVCGVRYRVVGTLPQGPYVALSKHSSQWETFFLQWYLFPVCVVLKRELLRIPFFGWALKRMEAIPIDRGNPRQAFRQTITVGAKRLRDGYNVLIFPEGTRIPFGQTGRYARGGAGLAIAGGVPVVPIAHDAGRYWPTRQFLIRPGTVTLVIGDAIPTAGRDSRELTDQVREWIEGQVAELSRETRVPPSP